MKQFFRLSLLLGILLTAMAPSARTEAQDLTTEKAAVENALQSFFDAARAKNWPAIDTLLASDFRFYSDAALVLDKAGFIAAMKEDDMEMEQLKLEDVNVVISKQADVAWITYRAKLESTIKGRPYNMMSVETVAFRKDDNRWKLVHNHASVKTL